MGKAWDNACFRGVEVVAGADIVKTEVWRLEMSVCCVEIAGCSVERK